MRWIPIVIPYLQLPSHIIRCLVFAFLLNFSADIVVIAGCFPLSICLSSAPPTILPTSSNICLDFIQPFIAASYM